MRAPPRKIDTRREAAPLRGVVLVGGDSRRFGSPKQLAAFRGSSFGALVVAALEPVVGEPFAVGAGALPPALGALPRLSDARGSRGPIAGLLGALEATPATALLAVACDQPLVTHEALRWLVAHRRAGAIAVVARLGAGAIEPLPGIYEPESLAVLAELAAAGGSLQPLGVRDDVVVATPPRELARAWTSVDTEEKRAELEREAIAREAAAPERPRPPTIGSHRGSDEQ